MRLGRKHDRRTRPAGDADPVQDRALIDAFLRKTGARKIPHGYCRDQVVVESYSVKDGKIIGIAHGGNSRHARNAQFDLSAKIAADTESFPRVKSR